MDASRREFTTWGITGATSLFSGFLSPAFAATHASGSGVPWYKTVKRIGQTNFNERDPEFGDVEAWADYWASAKVQAVALSVSGPVAFYPTKVPFFHVSSYLKGRDLFGECLHAAKKRGLRVFGRMSPDIQYTDPKLLAVHPLWFRRDKAGNIQSPAPNIAFTCQFSGQFTEQQPKILRELTSRYDIDGLYMNGWPTVQQCYCETCRKIGDPESAQYKAALMERAVQMTDLYRGIVTAKNPNNFYSCNISGGMDDPTVDQWQLTRAANWYTSDNQARGSVDEPIWQAAEQMKYARAVMGDRPVAAVTAAYTRSGPVLWRQVTDASAEPTLRMAQTAATGGIIWYHQLGLTQGFTVDRRWQAPGRDFLSWHAANEPHFHNLRSLANVAIVAPVATMSRQKDPKGKSTDYLQGLYAALLEARIPFDFVHENDLTAERLAPYDLLVLPNFAIMSDAQARALEAYVRRGGSLLATFRTGLFDEAGRPRADFALGSVFGISKASDEGAATATGVPGFTPIYLQSIRQRGPITEGFDGTEWIAGPANIQPIKPIDGVPLTFIEPYPVYPPEAVYPRTKPTDFPSVVTKQAGAARLVYFAGDMDASSWRLDNPDLGRQLVNALRWVLADKAPVSVTGDGLMEVVAWKTAPGYALHLLNYNGPNAFRGHMRRLLPLGPQQVRMTLSDRPTIKSAKLLRANQPLDIQQSGDTVSFTVPAVADYEVVALEV